MFCIALCDDEGPQRKFTRRMLEDYFARRDLTAKICEFAGGRELLDALREQRFDLYLLDIVMPELDGIRLGVALRDRDKDGLIIYLTTSPDFALESFDARAFSYLLKPVREEKLFAVLDDAIALRERHDASVIVRTAEGTVRLSLDSILYVELASRAPRYYLNNGSHVAGVTIRASFQDAMKPLLDDKRFHLCGSSFVFNLRHIRSMNKSKVFFDGERWAAPPRRAFPALQSAWMDYWLEGGGQNV